MIDLEHAVQLLATAAAVPVIAVSVTISATLLWQISRPLVAQARVTTEQRVEARWREIRWRR